ncbi:Bcr/CflA family efflux MFS transporter [Agrobacterium tumefaciens]|uniref:Bcr/CflA family efflux MFS transporter n=1 Tax=Agrobacterium tumefaciens TaxID=358 RepID=UPI001572FEC7
MPNEFTEISAGEQTPATKIVAGRTIALLAALSAIGTLSTTIILPSFPSMAADFHVSLPDLGMTLSSFLVAFAMGQLFVGPMSDRFGRRPFVIGGLLVFATGSLLCASANEFSTLILGRVVQALGACAASVLSRAVARDLFDGERLTRALSLIMIAMAAAPGFSPLIGTGLETLLNWRWIFSIVAFASILLLILYLVGMGETHSRDRRAAHTVSAVARSYVSLLTDRRFITPSLAIGLIAGALYAFFGITPAIMLGTLSLAPLHLGLFYAATVFIVFGAGMASPRLVHSIGVRAILLTGLSLALMGGLLILVRVSEPSFAAFALAITVFLAGFGIANPVLTASALQPFGSRAGLASALLGFIQMGGAAMATGASTLLPFSPFGNLGCLMTVALLAAVIIYAAFPANIKAAPQ